MSGFRYRPEVDGLRAISVIGVLLYHVGLGFPGGFVGVDVFFVISGFLITGLILKDLENGTFTFENFWVRRIRRIFPALFAMIGLVLVTGSWMLLPADFRDLGKTVLAQALMSANFQFASGAGYFDPAMELKPLLHTWSLAVEEQFYLVFPVLLWGLHRFRPRAIGRVLWILAAVSFALSVVGVMWAPLKTFYLLPTRAWELLAGSLLAVSRPSRSLTPWMGGILGWSGVLLISGTMVCYDATTPFPGLAALLPVLGGVLVILGADRERNAVGRVLASRPMVFVGLISYSLYLWHWPILAFVRYVTPDLDLGMKVVIVACSLAAGWGSCRWIERPFRKPVESSSKRRVFAVALIGQVGIVAIGWGLIAGEGWPWRYSVAQRELIAEATPEGAKFSVSTADLKAGRIPTIGARDVKPTFVVLGDSHALAVRDVLAQVAEKQGISGYFIAEGGSLPLPGIGTKQIPVKYELLARGEAAATFLATQGIENVILIARWSAYVEGMSDYDVAVDSTRRRHFLLAVDGESREVSREEALRVMQRRLTAFVQDCRARNARVWIVGQVPESLTGIAEVGTKRRLLGLPYSPPETTQADHQRRQSRIQPVLENLAGDRVDVLDPTAGSFDERGVLIVESAGRFLYRDDDHLTQTGAELRMKPVLQPILEEIANTPYQERPRSAVRQVDHKILR